MPYEQESVPHASETHRYFPEWADRPVSADRLLEADHNSYLAGGYSEEFGYFLRSDRAAVYARLNGDPDRSGQWAVQIDCLHPGYPECPRPADRIGTGPQTFGDDTGHIDGRRPVRLRAGAELHVGVGHVLEVSRAGAERRTRDPLPFFALWTRLRLHRRLRGEVM